jgi:hypothetical protein
MTAVLKVLVGILAATSAVLLYFIVSAVRYASSVHEASSAGVYLCVCIEMR